MEPDRYELNLRDYLVVLRRRWLIIVSAAVVLGLGAFLWSNSKTRLYTASAEVLVDTGSAQWLDSQNNRSAIPTPQRVFENELRYANSAVVRAQVTTKVGYEPDISATGNSQKDDVIAFKATSPVAGDASRIAQLYSEIFIRARTQRTIENFRQAREAVETLLEQLNAQLADLPNDDSNEVEAQRKSLESQITAYNAQKSALLLSEQTALGNGASIITNAEIPTAPVSPKPMRTATLAVVLGLLLGTGLAFLIEFLDDTLRTSDDLERVAGGATMLGMIPRNETGATANLAAAPVSGPLGEAFRSLRTSVQFVGLRRTVRAVQVTSADPSEGKTTISCHLAVAMAQAGEQVVLIDCDLRNPSVAPRFGLSNDVGLSNVLLRQLTVHDALHPVAAAPGLMVLPSGPLPGNPADFLWAVNAPPGSVTLPQLIGELTQQGFFVVVDTPPVLPVADAMTISRFVDGTLLVVCSGSTGTRELARALEMLRQADANVLGTVLNNLPDERGGYGYGYGYGYHRVPQGPLARILRRFGRQQAPAAPARVAASMAMPAPLPSNGQLAPQHRTTTHDAAVPASAPSPVLPTTPQPRVVAAPAVVAPAPADELIDLSPVAAPAARAAEENTSNGQHATPAAAARSNAEEELVRQLRVHLGLAAEPAQTASAN